MAEHVEPLVFRILAKCSTTKARTAILTLPHYAVETPVFMPVGTQGTMKGLTCKQLEDLDCQIILSNTYHLGMRPVSLLFASLQYEMCRRLAPCQPHADPNYLVSVHLEVKF